MTRVMSKNIVEYECSRYLKSSYQVFGARLAVAPGTAGQEARGSLRRLSSMLTRNPGHLAPVRGGAYSTVHAGWGYSGPHEGQGGPFLQQPEGKTVFRLLKIIVALKTIEVTSLRLTWCGSSVTGMFEMKPSSFL